MTHHCVEAGHPVLAGHFPGNPIVPGAYLLSLVVQQARAVVGESARRVGGVRIAKFTRPLRPGQHFEIVLGADEGEVMRFRIMVDDDAIATGILSVEPA